MTRKTSTNSYQEKINFEKWICDIVDPVINDVESLIPDDLTSSQKAIKAYWVAFAQNTINLSRIMSCLPHHFPQIMMSFRLLQETSADIFYLNNHRENIATLVNVESEVQKLKNGDFTLRHMSQIIARTDIRSRDVANRRKDGTQERIDTASKFLEKKLGKGMTKDLRDINNLLNGYSHFNPAGVCLQNNLTDNGYFETYMKVLSFYPAWLYLILVSLSELLGLKKLSQVKSKEIIEDLFAKIGESNKWFVEFVPKPK